MILGKHAWDIKICNLFSLNNENKLRNIIGFMISVIYIIQLLYGYEGIAFLLSLRHQLIPEAKPMKVVCVEGDNKNAIS
jgi:hypothetical protein